MEETKKTQPKAKTQTNVSKPKRKRVKTVDEIKSALSELGVLKALTIQLNGGKIDLYTEQNPKTHTAPLGKTSIPSNIGIKTINYLGEQLLKRQAELQAFITGE